MSPRRHVSAHGADRKGHRFVDRAGRRHGGERLSLVHARLTQRFVMSLLQRQCTWRVKKYMYYCNNPSVHLSVLKFDLIVKHLLLFLFYGFAYCSCTSFCEIFVFRWSAGQLSHGSKHRQLVIADMRLHWRKADVRPEQVYSRSSKTRWDHCAVYLAYYKFVELKTRECSHFCYNHCVY